MENKTPGNATTAAENSKALAIDVDAIACDISYSVDIIDTISQTLVDLLGAEYETGGCIQVENYYLKTDARTALQYARIICDYIRNIKDSNNELEKVTSAAFAKK